MAEAAYAAWAEHSVAGYAEQLVDSGAVPADAAATYAAEQLAVLLPHGPDTPGHHLWTVHDANGAVGAVWVHLRPHGRAAEAFLYDVELDERVRGRGLGRATMHVLVDRCRALGAQRLLLNVFAHNPVATALYRSLGFVTALTVLTRTVDDPGGPDRPTPLRDLTAGELAVLRPRWVDDRAREIVGAELLPAAEARQRSLDEHAVLQRDGVRTPGALLWVVEPADQEALSHRAVWLQETGTPGERRATAHRLPEDAETVEAVLAACARRGLAAVEVSAFGVEAADRRVAQGFEPVARTMLLAL
jgi:GNAT superfamily N-acetyltransferase